jgi:hypothetical protein
MREDLERRNLLFRTNKQQVAVETREEMNGTTW